MRLYLSSFRLAADPSHFVRLAGGQKVGLVVNALDNRLQAREAWGDRQAKELSTLGFSVREVDLRSYFGDPRGLAIELAALDAIWINGGKTHSSFAGRCVQAASTF